jgi:TonB family protein
MPALLRTSWALSLALHTGAGVAAVLLVRGPATTPARPAATALTVVEPEAPAPELVALLEEQDVPPELEQPTPPELPFAAPLEPTPPLEPEVELRELDSAEVAVATESAPTFDVGPSRPRRLRPSRVVTRHAPPTTVAAPPAAPHAAPRTAVRAVATPDLPRSRELAALPRPLVVDLLLTVEADGRVSDVRVDRGSGHARFDESARAWVLERWRFAASAERFRTRVPFRLDR